MLETTDVSLCLVANRGLFTTSDTQSSAIKSTSRRILKSEDEEGMGRRVTALQGGMHHGVIHF